jgi:peptidoglycan/LPS O-acetylase OafA/YrhL
MPGIGMPLFFVLSGFVIHYNYHRPIVDNPARGVINFLVARFARLYPLFIVVVCYALFTGGYFENLNDPAVRSQFYAATPSYLALVQSWYYRIIGDRTLIYVFPAMTQVTWSISTEWFFYLVYPFACIVLTRLRRPGPIILATAMVVAAGYASVYCCAAHLAAIDSYGAEHYGAIAGPGGDEDFRGWLLYLSPYPHLFEFALGCLSAALLVAVGDRPVTRWEARLGRCGLVFAIGSIAVTYVTLYRPDAQLSSVQSILGFDYFGFAPFIAVLLFCCTRYRSWVSAALSRPWMVLCGEASYSIYLIHVGVVQYAEQFDKAAGTAPSYNGWSVLHAVVELVLLTATVIGLSLISYNVIEVPARRWLRRWLSLPARRIAVVEPHSGRYSHQMMTPAGMKIRTEIIATLGASLFGAALVAVTLVTVVLVDYVLYPTKTEPIVAAPQAPAPIRETALADLPGLPDAVDWVLIWGLNARPVDTPAVVSGETPLQLTAIPTDDSDAQNRHAVAMKFSGLNPGGVYRSTVWVKSAGTNIQVQVRGGEDSVVVGEALFNLDNGSTLMDPSDLLAHGLDTTADGWNKAWVDLKSEDGNMFVLLGLLEDGGTSNVITGEGEHVLLGGIEVALKP